MLQFRYGKFHTFGAAFAIPEGCFLETLPEAQYEDGVTLWSEDQDTPE